MIICPKKIIGQNFDQCFFFCDNSISKREIKQSVNKIYFFIDSVKNHHNIDVDVKINLVLYFNDLDKPNLKWTQLQKRFAKYFNKKVGDKNVVIFPNELLPSEFPVKQDCLGIGPMFFGPMIFRNK